MNFDVGEGTSDGRGRATREHKQTINQSEVTMKQENEIKEEPNDNAELVEVNELSGEIPAVGTISAMEMENDDQLNTEYDFDGVKNEFKNEAEEGESAPNKSCEDANEQPNGVDAGDRGDEKQNGVSTNSNNDCKRQRSNGKEKAKVNGRNRILTKKRTMATALKTRKVRAKPQKIHKCSQCDYIASYKTNLTNHIRIHTGEKPFACEICSKSFTQKSNLTSHKMTHAPQSNIRCSKCHCRFRNENAKAIHEAKRKCRQYECHLCKCYTLKVSNLKVHMRIHHTREKPFECPVCSKTFTAKAEAFRHSRVHSKQLPFACMKCGRRFVDEQGKQSHEKRCNGRQLECFICRYNCFQMDHLKKHMRTKHTGEKRFCCGICDKKFDQKSHLNQHLAVHTKISCSKCLRRFKDKNIKMEHEKRCNRRHYQCYLCKINVQHLNYLKNHVQKHHVETKMPQN